MGYVYLVGAGPGDPELLTLKAVKCIQSADVILYDRLVNQEILSYAKKEAESIYCGKQPNNHSMKQEEIHQLLIQFAKEGKKVTRLKGGDPFVFGRGAEEAEQLAQAGIDFEIVPGITSGLAAPLYAGIPVTHREFSSNTMFISGHMKKDGEKELNWEYVAAFVDTLVIYMGITNLIDICKRLMVSGKNSSTPLAVIHWGTYKHQKTVISSLQEVCEKGDHLNFQSPSIVVIGEVVRFHEKINWLAFKQEVL
ncbi:uroporphyrinogen-III C-methyltransferase [Bacillus carboniphilus]|uniref:uroporphyrinogen-III C-methyltransferase n=1 Tax=Bacillus carboniphilus TaxID=86663 RepID=A0ABY9JW13_9BACI|nr:uroporphyrinogen-III C-methyltransferase [Bacillus carboniphilus]WLR43587.1 uroporphyrinogen-III C-methyltransferase [Bacillus carboniphilus]